MCPRKHWNMSIIIRHESYCVNHFIHSRKYNFIHGLFQHQCMGEVINILRGTSKMEKLKHLRGREMHQQYKIAYKVIKHLITIQRLAI